VWLSLRHGPRTTRLFLVCDVRARLTEQGTGMTAIVWLPLRLLVPLANSLMKHYQ
jgi:hypothetical protein